MHVTGRTSLGLVAATSCVPKGATRQRHDDDGRGTRTGSPHSQLFSVLIRKHIVTSASGPDGEVAMKNDR